MIIEAITINTKDVPRIRSFYQNVFGISDEEIIRHGEDHEALKLENMYFGFDKFEETHDSGNTVIWFMTEDVEELFEKFVASGAKINYKPDTERSPGETLAELYDIDGNKIGLIGPVKQ